MARVVSGFRSGPSKKACFLQIVNKTSRPVNIIWVDYYGRETNYGMVEPRNVKSIHSYEGHPWLCRDSNSKKRLLLNNSELFIPTCAVPDPRGLMDSFPIVEVIISIPLFKLQDICAEIIRRCVSSEDDIHSLGLPPKMNDLVMDAFRHATSP